MGEDVQVFVHDNLFELPDRGTENSSAYQQKYEDRSHSAYIFGNSICMRLRLVLTSWAFTSERFEM